MDTLAVSPAMKRQGDVVGNQSVVPAPALTPRPVSAR
jgi:hypothetical protein